MIVIDRPQVTDLYIPRSGNSEACLKNGCFGKKDILDILSNYITIDSAYTILDEIFLNYISGDNNLTELILNAVGDVYTREQVDEMLEAHLDMIENNEDDIADLQEDKADKTQITGLQGDIAELQGQLAALQEQVNSLTGYTPSPDTGSTPTPEPEIDYRTMYFTIECTAPGTFGLENNGGGDPISVSYKLNDGLWTTASGGEFGLDLEDGDKVMIRGNGPYNGYTFEGDAEFNVYGNILSLIGGQHFLDSSYIPENAFLGLFAGSNVVDASNLILPRYTNLQCYYAMFNGCGLLTGIPTLNFDYPATRACAYMFSSCPLIESAVLPARGANDYAYEAMFDNCTGLKYINVGLTDYNNLITANWVANAGNGSGLFVHTENSTWPTNNSGRPAGWEDSTYCLDVPDGLTFGYDSESKYLTINSYDDWRISTDDSWISLNRRSGQSGEASVRVTVESTTSPRIGTITISNSYETKTVYVCQSDIINVYVDDFPDGTTDWGYTDPFDPDFVSEFYNYDTFEEYVDAYVADPEENGSNKYTFAGMMTFNGQTYKLFKLTAAGEQTGSDIDNTSVAYALMDASYTYDYLASRTMEANYTNQFEPFAYYLGPDKTLYQDVMNLDGGFKNWLVKLTND